MTNEGEKPNHDKNANKSHGFLGIQYPETFTTAAPLDIEDVYLRSDEHGVLKHMLVEDIKLKDTGLL